MFKEIKLLDIESQVIELDNLSCLKPFSDEIIEFLNSLSIKFLSLNNSQQLPELTVLGFWLRKSNILNIKKNYNYKNKNKTQVSRGLVFQIPPSNVNSISIYSWALSLLAGNKNVIRISKTKSQQMHTICMVLEDILRDPEWLNISQRNKFFVYEYEDQINEYLSSKCDLRVVWGGDRTVKKIRKFDLMSYATEINFPDKFSISIININKFSKIDEATRLEIVKNFMNDSYWFDQMACSSPRILIWLSTSELDQSIKNDFWKKLNFFLQDSEKKLTTIDSINKQVASDRISIELPDSKVINHEDRLITRISINEIIVKNEIMPGAGFFYECEISKLEEIIPILNRKLQTISYYGFNSQEWRDFITNNNIKGIDRIVPIGKALDFEEVWDGTDLISSFLREITIR
tara:strand:- start:6696 stop:7907 length:1212 start_codon:yes stop_codon:yes gene_type:complete